MRWASSAHVGAAQHTVPMMAPICWDWMSSSASLPSSCMHVGRWWGTCVTVFRSTWLRYWSLYASHEEPSNIPYGSAGWPTCEIPRHVRPDRKLFQRRPVQPSGLCVGPGTHRLPHMNEAKSGASWIYRSINLINNTFMLSLAREI